MVVPDLPGARPLAPVAGRQPSVVRRNRPAVLRIRRMPLALGVTSFLRYLSRRDRKSEEKMKSLRFEVRMCLATALFVTLVAPWNDKALGAVTAAPPTDGGDDAMVLQWNTIAVQAIDATVFSHSFCNFSA
jgi:hypothetical protein